MRKMKPAILHKKTQQEAQASPWPDCLLSMGEMGIRIREFDWSATPLGPITLWSKSLQTVTRMMLSSDFPKTIHWGPDYIQIYNNEVASRIGHRHPGMLGNIPAESWSERWKIKIQPHLEEVWQTEKTVLFEDIQSTFLRSGRLLESNVLQEYTPFYDDQGNLEGVLVTIINIDDQVFMERRLKILQQLAERALDVRNPDDVYRITVGAFEQNTADIPFALIYLLDDNLQTARLAATASIQPEQPASPSIIALSSPDENGWPLNTVLTAGPQHVEDLESRFGSLPGGPWPESTKEAFLLPISPNMQGRPIGILIAGISPRLEFNDQYRHFYTMAAAQMETAITKALAYEQEQQRLETLMALDRAKTVFFSNISHEFRTPLTLILGPVEDALQDPGTIPENRNRMTVAYHNTLRLLKLVNTLLDFSRIEAGRIQAAYRPIDLSRFTAELASNFQSAMEKAALSFIIHCPPLSEPLYVDVEMWEKIVLNLISNAFKNTFAGEIEIALALREDHAALSVRDTGIGIAEDQLEQIFERFHRAPNASARTQEGSGIGLALVKDLVKLHGGTIGVESKVGVGSTFTVSIPTGYAHLPQERVVFTSPSEPMMTSTAAGAQPFVQEVLSWLPQEPADIPPVESVPIAGLERRPRVLLADDSSDMRTYIWRLLQPHYEVTTVSDGQAALEFLSHDPPDLVLTDIMMPRLDGFGLLKAIRSDKNLETLPVIMLSARAGEEASIEGLSAGADDYLVKPFSANELLARVRTHLEMARIRRESEETLRQAQKMQVVGQLAGGVAHDFNSLLTVMMGRLHLLKSYISDEAGQRMLDSASHTAERAAKLTKQLLAFARKQPLQAEPTSLNALILAMDPLLQNALGNNIDLKRNLAEDLWTALADPTQIQLAVLNLTLNACDAMPQGGVLILATGNVYVDSATVADLEAGDYVLLSVSDTGVGMSNEVLAQAFEPFFTTKGVGRGTGLGLSQVYGTAKQLGGTARLKSMLGQGTTVEIFLPRMPDPNTR